MKLEIVKRKSKKTNKPYYAVVYTDENDYETVLTFDMQIILKLVTIPELAKIEENESFILL